MAGIKAPVSEQFHSAGQRREGAYLGMWLFLSTEFMMFGGLLCIIWYYRLAHEMQVSKAVEHLHYGLGGFNSALLLTSSFIMSLAIQAARKAKMAHLRSLLLVSVGLACAFLALKGYEYHSEYQEGLLPVLTSQAPLKEPAARLFMGLYLISTALHAMHILVAILLGAGIWLRLRLGRLPMPERLTVIETFAFYWHAVDVIWIFLFPSLYLIGRPV